MEFVLAGLVMLAAFTLLAPRVARWYLVRAHAAQAEMARIACTTPAEYTELTGPLPDRLKLLSDEAVDLGLEPAGHWRSHTAGYDLDVATVALVSADRRFQMVGVVGFDDDMPPPLFNLFSRLDGGRAMLATERHRQHPHPPHEFVQVFLDISLADMIREHETALARFEQSGVVVDRHEPETARELAAWEHEFAGSLWTTDPEQAQLRFLRNMALDIHEGGGQVTTQEDFEVRLATYLAGREQV